MTGDEFRVFLKENYSDLSIYEQMAKKQGLVNTDWQDEIFRTTLNTEHNLSVYGTAAKVMPYRVSFGYTNIDGILKTSKTERYTGSFSVTPSLFDDHLKINLNGRGMYVKNRFADWGQSGPQSLWTLHSLFMIKIVLMGAILHGQEMMIMLSR